MHANLKHRGAGGTRRSPRPGRLWAASGLVVALALTASACSSVVPSASSHHTNSVGLGTTPTTAVSVSTVPTTVPSAPASNPLSSQSLDSLDSELTALNQNLAQVQADASPSQGDS